MNNKHPIWQAAKQVGMGCQELRQNLLKLHKQQHDLVKVGHVLQRRWLRYNYANQPHYDKLQSIFSKMSK